MNKEKKIYFTKEFQERVNSMTNGEMNSLLLSIESTDYWIAIVKYLQERSIPCTNALTTIDPFKDPGNLCKYQGILIGLSDLQNMVVALYENSKVSNSEKKE
jgi:hypothetical protein